MNNEELFVSIIDDCRRNETTPKLSSKIKEWLGKDIPQSLCIRIGNYLEQFFHKITNTQDDLNQLDQLGAHRGVWHEGEFHQVDFIKITTSCIYHREIKTNTSLDRGKKRDTLRREQAIIKALQSKFMRPVDSAIFCPFLKTSQNIGGLGTVEGLTEFIQQFQASITVDQFYELGVRPEVHKALAI